MKAETMTVILLIGGLIVLSGVVAWVLLFTSSMTEEVPAQEIVDEETVPTDIPTRMSLTGTYVCLPHKTEPSTKECASGIKTDDGKYYAFDISLSSLMIDMHVIRVGDPIGGTGVFTPREMLSSDHWFTYNFEGVFSVTDGFTHEQAK